MIVLAVAAVAFVTMEGVTYLAHRFVMHGVGWLLHRSHHESSLARFEANDAYPIGFGALTVAVMALGFQLPMSALVAATVGVTMYGAAYLFVHDVYIHGRLGRLPRVEVLERLRSAHLVHHLYKGEPFGMLLPYIPRSLRDRSAANTWDGDGGGVELVQL